MGDPYAGAESTELGSGGAEPPNRGMKELRRPGIGKLGSAALQLIPRILNNGRGVFML